MNQHALNRLLAPAFALAALAAPAVAGTTTASEKQPVGKDPIAPPAKEESVFDKIWGLATIYKDESNPIIEEFSITGRYHGQYYYADSDTGSDDDWENRRFRIGAKALLFNKHVEVKGEIFSDLNEPYGEFYDGFTELYVRFMANDAFNLTVGKQKPKFGWEWSTSSRTMLTFERSINQSMFREDYTPGVTIDGKVGKFSYYAGVFADDTEKEFAGFDGGQTYIATMSYDLKDATGWDKTTVSAGYVHSEREAGDEVFTYYDNGFSLALETQNGAFGLDSEILVGDGAATNYGLIIQPHYDITKKLQVVGRYTLALSDDANGILPRSRYERRAGGTPGDTYNAFYGGVNYYIYGHKLKLMTGVEYAKLDGGTGKGYDGWTAFAGIRAYW